MADNDPKTGAAAARVIEPLGTYDNLDLFHDRLATQSSKSPSLLALQSLINTRPDIAKQIFERAVMEPFFRLLAAQFPSAPLSEEGKARTEVLQAQFLQQPIFVIGMLEAIFVIERITPWAEDTAKLMSKGQLTLSVTRCKYPALAQKMEANGYALASSDLHMYTRERDYRIMLELVSAIDGRSVEEQAVRILDDLPVLKGVWAEYGDGATKSIIGTDGAKKIVDWILGYVEF
jgi:hypothetical protein